MSIESINEDAVEMQYLLSRLSVKSIEEAIEFVTRSDLEGIRIDDFKAALYEILRAYGCYTKSIKKGVPLFRAMKHHAGEQFFENVKRIYPDPNFLTDLGRANREKQPIFYLSGDPVIAFHEIKPKPGDVISLLECRPRDAASPMLVPIGIDELMKRHGVRAGGDFPENSIRIQDLLANDEESLRKYWMIDKFVTTGFLKDVAEGQNHEYKTSIAIAELLFSYSTTVRPIDGLAYPTIAGMWTHANIALSPGAFHRIYRPFACQRIMITGLLPELGFALDPEIGVMANDINSDGTICWPHSAG